ncbi:protoporphyrinogen oxidase [Nocardioides limicola]|uniref:protoporphyrinogen oxidase n=1 Tax=Nocardioides limicola TaxID=2803368 RepID=UPI00193B28B4|nr:protoporphyrinogen oxidase [Nocardioides sp. DJM-14]
MKVIVVGGGVAGLTAAHDLGLAGHRVEVLESTDRVGGKLRRAEVAGVGVDVGAEAMLARRPEGLALCAELGLEVAHPTAASPRLWIDGALRPLPSSVMGVPLDVDEVAAAGVLSAAGLARLRAEPTTRMEIAEDVSVGDLVDHRLGPEVTDRLVEPLLGGVYAGQARQISLRAAVPVLELMLRSGSLLAGAAAARPDPGAPRQPVFAALPGGMARLPEALVAAGHFTVATETTVTEISGGPHGFRVRTEDGAVRAADRLVLATPPAPTARLLRDLAPAAATDLSRIETASVVVVTFAFRAEDVPDAGASGFLVPPDQGRRIKASTFSFAKWDWVREAGRGAGPADEDLLFLRTSLGRHGESRALAVEDSALVAASLADLADAAGITADPVDVHVQRWGGGLPQYAVGHQERVQRIRDAVGAVPGLAVCGAAYDGVGIPAVIASARRAASDVLAD